MITTAGIHLLFISPSLEVDSLRERFVTNIDSPRNEVLLDLDGGLHGPDGAGEFGEQGIAGGVHRPGRGDARPPVRWRRGRS